MTLTQLINYMGLQWPDIYDAHGCASWIIKRSGGIYATQPLKEVDQLCCFWMRHEFD
jgi:hypothetical protein